VDLLFRNRISDGDMICGVLRSPVDLLFGSRIADEDLIYGVLRILGHLRLLNIPVRSEEL